MSTMHVTCFLYSMKVIKHGVLFFQNSYFFKKLHSGILSGPETGRSCRATFQFVFSKTTGPFWTHEQNIQRRGPGRFYSASEREGATKALRPSEEYTRIATGQNDWVEDSLQWSGSVPCQLKNPFQLMTLVTYVVAG